MGDIHERAEAICLSLRTLAGDNSRVDSAAMREAADLIRDLSKMVREREAAEARARIEGARMMQEAALVEVCTDRTIEKHGAHCCCTTCELNCAEDGIRALSPEAIVKGEV